MLRGLGRRHGHNRGLGLGLWRGRGTGFLAAAILALAGPLPGEVLAQSQPGAAPQGAATRDVAAGDPFADLEFRVLNQDRLLRESQLGQGILADLREAEVELEAENQQVSDQLATEERELTALRATLPPEEFRLRADEFDRRVEAIRGERARLGQELARRYEREAQQFFQTALPVLLELMEDEGIVAFIRPDALILGMDGLDITPEAIRRLDAARPE